MTPRQCKLTNLFVIAFNLISVLTQGELQSSPVIVEQVSNVTVSIGKQAHLTCRVHNLRHHKVGWMKSDSQTVLTMGEHVVTSDHRVRVQHTTGHQWTLKIASVQESDAGCYMCQVNSETMVGSAGCLLVKVSPRFIAAQMTRDVTTSRGSNVTLRCSARGRPMPSMQWLRHGLPGNVPLDVTTVTGSDSVTVTLRLTSVDRSEGGAYFCIARNGVPPAISQRTTVNILFGPIVKAYNSHVRLRSGQEMRLQCLVEGYPTPHVHWQKEQMSSTPRHMQIVESFLSENRLYSALQVDTARPSDSGRYLCSASSELAETSVSIQVHVLPALSSGRSHIERRIGFDFTTKKKPLFKTSTPGNVLLSSATPVHFDSSNDAKDFAGHDAQIDSIGTQNNNSGSTTPASLNSKRLLPSLIAFAVIYRLIG